jgi:heat-inducible transcriptional repressor
MPTYISGAAESPAAAGAADSLHGRIKMTLKEGDRPSLGDLSERARDILRHVVESYMESGAPVGSRTISRKLGLGLSPATIRNVMADLEDLGLLFAPHTSAGRLPTDMGMGLFVNGLLERGNLTRAERENIEALCAASGRGVDEVLEEASGMLSGLSRCAGLVVAPRLNEPLKHIEFISLGAGRALVVLVFNSGAVENRVIDVPIGLPASSLVEAGNYLTARLVGRDLKEAQRQVAEELERHRSELDALAAKVVESGLATWSEGQKGVLIVRGQAQLLDDVQGLEDLERIRQLFSVLETKDSLLNLLKLTESAQGVQIFIGADNELFNLAGCSAIIAPYNNAQNQIVGAVGIVGPSRIDYARLIPMVDYTAKVIGRLLG